MRRRLVRQAARTRPSRDAIASDGAHDLGFLEAIVPGDLEETSRDLLLQDVAQQQRRCRRHRFTVLDPTRRLQEPGHGDPLYTCEPLRDDGVDFSMAGREGHVLPEGERRGTALFRHADVVGAFDGRRDRLRCIRQPQCEPVREAEDSSTTRIPRDGYAPGHQSQIHTHVVDAADAKRLACGQRVDGGRGYASFEPPRILLVVRAVGRIQNEDLAPAIFPDLDPARGEAVLTRFQLAAGVVTEDPHPAGERIGLEAIGQAGLRRHDRRHQAQ